MNRWCEKKEMKEREGGREGGDLPIGISRTSRTGIYLLIYTPDSRCFRRWRMNPLVSGSDPHPPHPPPTRTRTTMTMTTHVRQIQSAELSFPVPRPPPPPPPPNSTRNSPYVLWLVSVDGVGVEVGRAGQHQLQVIHHSAPKTNVQYPMSFTSVSHPPPHPQNYLSSVGHFLLLLRKIRIRIQIRCLDNATAEYSPATLLLSPLTTTINTT